VAAEEAEAAAANEAAAASIAAAAACVPVYVGVVCVVIFAAVALGRLTMAGVSRAAATPKPCFSTPF